MTKMRGVTISDTSLNLQALASAGFEPYNEACANIVVSGTVALTYAKIGGFVSKMSAGSVVLQDVGSAILSFATLAPYRTQLSSCNITGSINIDYANYNALVASKFSHFHVSNVPVEYLSSVLSGSSVTVGLKDSASSVAAAISTIHANLLKIGSVTLVGDDRLRLTTADFVSRITALETYDSLTPVLITGTPSQIASSFDFMNARTALIHSIEVTGLSLTYPNFTKYNALVSKMTNPFSIEDVTCAGIPGAMATGNVVSFTVSDTLSNVMRDIQTTGSLSSNISSITTINITTDAEIIVPFATFQQHATIFNKFSFV